MDALMVSPQPTPRSPAAGLESPSGEKATAPRVSRTGPAGQAPLIRAVRAHRPDSRRVVHGWLDRFAQDPVAATAELVSLVLAVADVPSAVQVEPETLKAKEPREVVQELVAVLALEASEKGADFTQHWLVSREKGAARVKENYPMIWRDLAAAAPAQELTGNLLKVFQDWLLALTDCQFRSIRHVASVAALHLIEGLAMQARSIQEFCGMADSHRSEVEDAGNYGAARYGVKCPASSLAGELEQAKLLARRVDGARDALSITVLSRRTKDVDAEVRRSCFSAVASWVRADHATFSHPRWTRYIFNGLSDRAQQVRSAALGALHAVLRSEAGGGGAPGPLLKDLVERVRPQVLARCHDMDATVGAQAICCATLMAAFSLLSEDDFDPVIDLVWSPDAERRSQAAIFVSKFVFTEDVLDYPPTAPAGALMPTTGHGGATARRRLLMLLQFVGEYSEGHHQLVDRLASALWRRASCLEDWESIAGMLLPGGEHAVSGEQHVALVHLAEATAKLATEDLLGLPGSDVAIRAEQVLDRAARAFASRLPSLLTACQAEPAAICRAASLCRYILRHCVVGRSRSGGVQLDGLASGQHGVAAADALKAAFLRQPDRETLEHMAESLAYLLDLASGVRPTVKDLATSLRTRFMQLVQEMAEPASPSPDALLSTATRIKILTKAFDTSLCNLKDFGAAVLGLLDDRSAAVQEGKKPKVCPQLAVTLLEMLLLLLTRQVASLLQPQPLAGCTAHDDVDPEQLQLVPTASEDLCSVVASFLKEDPSLLVRMAAFSTGVGLLTAWWNCAAFSSSAPAGESKAGNGGGHGGAAAKDERWVLPLSDELGSSLCSHLGKVLMEANAVPPGSGQSSRGLAAGSSPQRPSGLSMLFALIQRALGRLRSKRAAGADARVECIEDMEAQVISDADRVQMAALACQLVSSCRHSDLSGDALQALVLSQALSPREDMQEAAWTLLRKLRAEAHRAQESARVFFAALLSAVRLVHQDAGAQMSRELSYRLLMHVGVGKIAPSLQVALILALKAGVGAALVEDLREDFCRGLVPWVTKHIVEDALLQELAAWAEQCTEDQEAAARAGIPALLEACRATLERGAATVAGHGPKLQDQASPGVASSGASSAGRGSAKRRRRGGGGRGAMMMAASPSITVAGDDGRGRRAMMATSPSVAGA